MWVMGMGAGIGAAAVKGAAADMVTVKGMVTVTVMVILMGVMGMVVAIMVISAWRTLI